MCKPMWLITEPRILHKQDITCSDNFTLHSNMTTHNRLFLHNKGLNIYVWQKYINKFDNINLTGTDKAQV